MKNNNYKLTIMNNKPMKIKVKNKRKRKKTKF